MALDALQGEAETTDLGNVMDKNIPADTVDIELLKKHPEKYPDLSVTQQYLIPYDTVMDIQLSVLRDRFRIS